jgi:hypothetical protein
MPSEAWLSVLGAENRNDRVCVAVTHLVLCLQESNLLHVSLVGDSFELGHPVIDWLAVLLFD